MKKLSLEDLQNKLHRVVEIYTPNPDDPHTGRLGSGFAVTDNLILTAKHVVQNAKQVRVRGLGEEWPRYRNAEVVWLSGEWDAALVRLANAPWSSASDRGESGLHWVHLSGQAPILCIAYGFPQATQFPSRQGRELEAIAGDIIPGAGIKRGTLHLNVKSALPLPTAEHSSPWQGLSGAAILTEQDRELIGLIVHDPSGFETSRLQGIFVHHLVCDSAFAQLVGVQATEPVGVQRKREDLYQQQAAQLRETLHVLENQCYSLSKRLTDGSVLIAGSVAIAKELRSRLGKSAAREGFWHYLDDHHLLLSVVVIGWQSSPETKLLMDVAGRVEQCTLSLHGDLEILLYPVQMLLSIIDDAYSPMMFVHIFSAVREMGTFRQEHKGEGKIDKLIDALTLELQGNSSLYVMVRYLEAINQLSGFIRELSGRLLNLDNRELLQMSKVEPKEASAQITRTDSMKVLLKELRGHIPEEDYGRLLEMIDNIAMYASKDNAQRNIEQRKKKEDDGLHNM